MDSRTEQQEHAVSTARAMVPSPSGGQRFLNRSLQVFFGHPILYALPAIAIVVLGLYTGLGRADQYRSIGTLSVSAETFLGNLSDVRSTDFNYETAARATSRQFNELMQTDGFARLVAEAANLEDAVASGETSLPLLRQSVFAQPTGDSLMSVIAVADNPELARTVAESAIATFKNWVTDSEISASGAAETFFEDQLQSYKVEVDAANEELTSYLIDHPAPADPRDERDTAEQLEIERLDAQLARAQDRFDSALNKREAARQATRESSADIDQRLQVLDAPAAPYQPDSGLRQLATNLIMFGVLGVFVSVAAVAFGSVLNRSILSVTDLDGIGAPVLAVVPRASTGRASRRRATADEPTRASTGRASRRRATADEPTLEASTPQETVSARRGQQHD